MISPVLARELKVAGLPWTPQRGDLAMDRLDIPYLVVADGADQSGGVLIDTGHGLERRPILSLTWLPHLEQLAAFLARHGSFTLGARPRDAARGICTWEVSLTTNARAGCGAPRVFSASTAADAVGQALLALLVEAGWSPGPALAGART